MAGASRAWLRALALAAGAAGVGCVVSPAMAQADGAAGAAAPATGNDTLSDRATFLLSPERWHDDSEIGWEGFLSGLRGFEHFYNPVGQPLYFETPFNNTGVRFLFLHHTFSDDSQLAGGEVNVVALQARVALTERLGFIATKDGYSWLNAGALPEDEGWNEIAAGLKYAFYVDRENDFVATAGARITLDSGESKIAMFGTTEVSPFISVAKGWDRFHVIGSATYRIPFDEDDGNQVFMWDLHADYEIVPESVPGLAPVVELHGVHYTSDGTRLPFSVGGLDYANFGSADVSGSSVVWAGFGARWKLSPHVSVGGVYEIGLTDHDADIMQDRVTFDVEVIW
ncbi:MAG: hypothetical protein SFY69_06985 [Planctomycetota bacterium]|nr:hypothetical protein [Planctomycetota bacterium]